MNETPSMALHTEASALLRQLRSFLNTDVVTACFLMFTILSGKLSFASMFPDRLLPDFLFELRLWSVLAVCWLLRRSLRDMQQFKEPILVGTLGLLAYLVIRSVGLDGSGEPILDALYLAIEVAAVAVLASRQRCVTAMGVLSITLALLLFLLALWGVKNEDLNGAGWAPIGGPITFYRLEFLGLCIAMFCFLNRPRILLLLLLLLLISVFFFATWSSLSKIALIASVIALAPVYIVCLARSRYMQAGLLTVALGAAFAVWQVKLGATMQLRVADSAVLQQGAGDADSRQSSRQQRLTMFGGTKDLPPQEVKLSKLQDIQVLRGLSPETPLLSPGQDLFIRSEYCIVSDAISLECRSNALTDRSGRLLMFAEAMRGFTQSPIVGNGLGQYAVRTVSARTMTMETYGYPHNILAEMAHAGGLFALALMFCMLTYAAHVFVNASIREPRYAAIVAFAIFMFLSALAAGDFYDLRLFLCMCVGLSVLHRKSSDTRP